MGVGWVCGRGFCGWVFGKGVLLGYFDGFFWGRPMRVNSGSQMKFPSENLNGLPLGDLEGLLVGKCDGKVLV